MGSMTWQQRLHGPTFSATLDTDTPSAASRCMYATLSPPPVANVSAAVVLHATEYTGAVCNGMTAAATA